jgi:hypothetical protein
MEQQREHINNAITAALWRDGRMIFCDIEIHEGRAPTIVKWDKELSDGDYELRKGEKVYHVTLKNGQWTPR